MAMSIIKSAQITTRFLCPSSLLITHEASLTHRQSLHQPEKLAR